MERWVNDPCRCLEPDCAPGSCPCGGAGARRFVARQRDGRRWSCLRCGRPDLLVNLCGDCAAILAAERAPRPPAASFPCAFCRRPCGAGFDLGGAFLCEVCAGSDIWSDPPPEPGGTDPACSFCGEVPRRAAIIAGPTIFLCSPCVERARALRRADHRDPPRDTRRGCSFDGKAFPELREMFVVGDLSFCDECVEFLDEFLRAFDMRARLGITRAAAGDRCLVCGGQEALLRPERGPAICAACVGAGRRVGRWCIRCRHGIEPAERAAQVGSGLLCAGCAAAVIHEARIVAFASRVLR